jgi:hypothetical protein
MKNATKYNLHASLFPLVCICFSAVFVPGECEVVKLPVQFKIFKICGLSCS